MHTNKPAEVPERSEVLAVVGGLDRPALQSQPAAAVESVSWPILSAANRSTISPPSTSPDHDSIGVHAQRLF